MSCLSFARGTYNNTYTHTPIHEKMSVRTRPSVKIV